MNSIDKILVFDIWGDYAHFRKPYTTTSPLTYSVPPRTAIAGLISAMIGIDKNGKIKDEYLNFFLKKDAFIGIRILKSIKKTRIAQNLIKTANSSNLYGIRERTQIRYELIKEPKYRIYFAHKDNDKIYNPLINNLKEHKSIYTPCLGLSEHIANFEFIDEYKKNPKEGEKKFEFISNLEEVKIDSVIPKNKVQLNDFEEGEFFSSTMPNEMQADRKVSEYLEIIYERNGRKIKCIPSEYIKLANENIIFL